LSAKTQNKSTNIFYWEHNHHHTDAIVDSTNGWTFTGPIIKNTTQIEISGEKLVFIDCSEQTVASWTMSKGGLRIAMQ